MSKRYIKGIIEPEPSHVTSKASLILYGDRNVGKSTITEALASQDKSQTHYHVSTYGCRTIHTIVPMDGNEWVKMAIHDAGGNNEYLSLLPTPKEDDFVVIVFSMIHARSLKQATALLKALRKDDGKVNMIVGTHVDLFDQFAFTMQDIQAFSTEHAIPVVLINATAPLKSKMSVYYMMDTLYKHR